MILNTITGDKVILQVSDRQIRCCEMTMGEYGPTGPDYYKCNRPAKYVTPVDKLNKRRLFVCGIHKRSVDDLYKRVNSTERCIPIAKA